MCLCVALSDAWGQGHGREALTDATSLSRERVCSHGLPAPPGPPTANPGAGASRSYLDVLLYLEPEEPPVFFPNDGGWPLVTVI